MKTKWLFVFLIGVFLLASVSTADAQKKWSVGTFFAYNVPIGQLNDQYGPDSKFGVNWSYGLTSRQFLELEYHRSILNNGRLDDAPFRWSVTGEDVVSPEAWTKLKMNSVVLNLLVFMKEAPSFQAKDFAYYFQVGVGFYDYTAERHNFVYPEQKNVPIDLTLVLQPQIDGRAALSGHAGFGVQAFVVDNVAVDIRGRWNVMMGDIRPMWDWGISNKTFPMQLLDFGAGMKFYFWK